MNVDQMIHYLKEAISFGTANDVWELPRPEFLPYVRRCEAIMEIPKAAYPFIIFAWLIEEQNSLAYKIKRFFTWKN